MDSEEVWQAKCDNLFAEIPGPESELRAAEYIQLKCDEPKLTVAEAEDLLAWLVGDQCVTRIWNKRGWWVYRWLRLDM